MYAEDQGLMTNEELAQGCTEQKKVPFGHRCERLCKLYAHIIDDLKAADWLVRQAQIEEDEEEIVHQEEKTPHLLHYCGIGTLDDLSVISQGWQVPPPQSHYPQQKEEVGGSMTNFGSMLTELEGNHQQLTKALKRGNLEKSKRVAFWIGQEIESLKVALQPEVEKEDAEFIAQLEAMR